MKYVVTINTTKARSDGRAFFLANLGLRHPYQSGLPLLGETCNRSSLSGGGIGVVAVLHTWTRALLYHPHVHCLVPAGGLSADGKYWFSQDLRQNCELGFALRNPTKLLRNPRQAAPGPPPDRARPSRF
jgi:hypothetical protein